MVTTKAVVALVMLAAVAAATVLAHRWIKAQERGGPAAGKARPQAARAGRGDDAAAGQEPAAADDLVPIACFGDWYIERGDGAIVTAVKVEARNSSLYTTAETIEESAAEAAVFASIDRPFAVFQVHRSPDNTRQRRRRQRMLDEIDSKLARFMRDGGDGDDYGTRKQREFLLHRRALIQRYMADDERSGVSRDVVETDTYLLLRTDQRGRRSAVEAANAATRALLTQLKQHEIEARCAERDELMWICKAYFDEPTAPGRALGAAAEVPLPHGLERIMEARAAAEGPACRGTEVA